ncbi:MAG: hypothetical protein Q7R81_07425 [Candidatus Peregrinibacteria bacterium]|nr:hypothetical protein [Candidatus Peregrinibacteria bacterium]
MTATQERQIPLVELGIRTLIEQQGPDAKAQYIGAAVDAYNSQLATQAGLGPDGVEERPAVSLSNIVRDPSVLKDEEV